MDLGRNVANLLRRRSWTWKWLLNFRRSVRGLLDRSPNAVASEDLQELRQNGIIIRSATDLLGRTGQDHLEGVKHLVQSRIAEPKVQQFLGEGNLQARCKRFRLALWSGRVEADSPLLALALEPAFLTLANAYLGMRCLLRTVAVWLDVPTKEPPADTQLWHRDDDDFSHLKVFIYLSDVAEADGPFCYIPGTHPGGDRAVPAEYNQRERISDAEMAAAVPPSAWQLCTGPAQTVVVADTRAFHKGLQPRRGHRRMIVLHYTSGNPNCPPDLHIQGKVVMPLTPVQRWALAG